MKLDNWWLVPITLSYDPLSMPRSIWSTMSVKSVKHVCQYVSKSISHICHITLVARGTIATCSEIAIAMRSMVLCTMSQCAVKPKFGINSPKFKVNPYLATDIAAVFPLRVYGGTHACQMAKRCQMGRVSLTEFDIGGPAVPTE